MIEPVCSIKPELKSWLGDKGEIQSRNASLSFQFNTAIDTTASIFYTESEINAIQGAQALKNGLGEIYGYTKGGETFFKNVEIFYKKRNINSSYGDFRYKKDSNTLIISPDTNNSFEIADDFAEIQVVFKSGIKNPDGAALTESSAYVNINKYSDEHSIINTYTNTSQTPATVTLAQQNLYLLEKKMISFTETEDTQFLYWDISSHSEYPDSVDKIATEINPETPEKITFWGKSKISSEEEVTVSAVYKYRPKITEFLPKDNEGVKPKDSDIEITFDAAVNLASFKTGYKILCNGNDVTGNFKTPYIKNAPDAGAGTSIIIEADAQNRLDIDTGSIKTISIVIPKDLYYQVAATDGKTYNITLGKDITKNFKIDNSTRTKAYIKFNLANNAGHAEDKIDISTPKTFNIGESVTFTVIENSDWQFTGWTKNGDANNAIEIVKSDDDYKTYTFKIKGACGSVNSPFIINAVCKERPKVKQTYPAYNAAGVPKDTDIELFFSKKPDLASCKDKITITCNNISVEENFPQSGWTINTDPDSNGFYKLTIPADKSNRLDITSLSTIKVNVDPDLSYTEDDITVLSGQSYIFQYRVNTETTKKANINISWNETYGSVKNAAGSNYNNSTTVAYNVGQSLLLNYVPAEDYDFVCWKVLGVSDTEDIFENFDISKNNISIKILKPIETNPVHIEPVCAQKFRITDIKINDEAYDKDMEYPLDSNILLTFSRPVQDDLQNKIHLKCNGTEYRGHFSFTFSDDKKNLLIVPLENTINKRTYFIDGFTPNRLVRTVNVTFDVGTNGAYSLVKASLEDSEVPEEIETRFYLDENEAFDYKINYKSQKKVTAKINIDKTVLDSVSIIDVYSGEAITRTQADYSETEEFSLNASVLYKIVYNVLSPNKVSLLEIIQEGEPGSPKRQNTVNYINNYLPDTDYQYYDYVNKKMIITGQTTVQPALMSVTNTSDGFVLPCDTKVELKFSYPTIIDYNDAAITIKLQDGTKLLGNSNSEDDYYYLHYKYSNSYYDTFEIKPRLKIKELFEQKGVSILKAYVTVKAYYLRAQVNGSKSRLYSNYELDSFSNGDSYDTEYTFPLYINNTVGNIVRNYTNIEVKLKGNSSFVDANKPITKYSDITSKNRSSQAGLTINAGFSPSLTSSEVYGNWNTAESNFGSNAKWTGELIITPLYEYKSGNLEALIQNSKKIALSLPTNGSISNYQLDGYMFGSAYLNIPAKTVYKLEIKVSNSLCGNTIGNTFYCYYEGSN